MVHSLIKLTFLICWARRQSCTETKFIYWCMFTRCMFTRCMFTRYMFTRRMFTRCMFTRCMFTRCKFNRCMFTRCMFTRCMFTRCVFTRCMFTRCMFTRCMFINRQCYSCFLYGQIVFDLVYVVTKWLVGTISNYLFSSYK